jgi:hypothetical protein
MNILWPLVVVVVVVVVVTVSWLQQLVKENTIKISLIKSGPYISGALMGKKDIIDLTTSGSVAITKPENLKFTAW